MCLYVKEDRTNVKTHDVINVVKCNTYALRNTISLRNVIPMHNVIKKSLRNVIPTHNVIKNRFEM